MVLAEDPPFLHKIKNAGVRVDYIGIAFWALERVAAPGRFRKPAPRIEVSRVGQQHIVRRKEEMRQQSVGSALSLADPVQVITKIVSLIDTVRYRNWPRRLILYIQALWADSLESSGSCNGHVNRCGAVGNTMGPATVSARSS